MPFQLGQKCKEHSDSKEEGAKGGGKGRQRKEDQMNN